MSDSIATCYDDPLWSPYDAPATPTSTGTAHSLFRLLKRDFKSPVSTTSSGSTIAQSQQPFRDECDCIIATFFAPNSRKELSLDSDVRDGVLYGLTTSTHPDIFLPAYEVIFYTLQTCSLPRFLACASAATNRPNQLLWFIWGLVCLCTSLVIYVTTLAFAPWDDFRSRALRLLCVFPAMVGTSFPYATSQGYCLNVSGRRKNMQLRPWELEGLGTPTREWWIDIISPIVVSHDNRDELEAQLEDTKNGNTGSGLSQKAMQDGAILPARLAEIAAHHARQRREAMLVDVSIIASCVDHAIVRQESSSTLVPSLMDALPGPAFLADDRLAPSITNHKHVDSEAYALHKMDDDLMTSASIAVSVKELTCSVGGTQHPHHNLRAGFPPPPIFGPEKVVLDPRIMAVHQTIMRKVLAIQIFTFVVSPSYATHPSRLAAHAYAGFRSPMFGGSCCPLTYTWS
jgi:hypothetical protein